jgi:3-dehydroquinate dehydratase/shikimate dehydrogenase
MDFPICLCVYGDTTSITEALKKNPDADLFEIRLDLSEKLNLKTIRFATSKPLIVASHSKPELLKEASSIADYVDTGTFEISVQPGKHIVSFHGSEEDAVQLWRKLNRDSITKLVLETSDYKKISKLLDLDESYREKAICFALGEIGAFSRILSVVKGARWIYASLPGQPTGAGQFTIDELLQLYRVKRFTTAPDVFGILGNPVSHSRSPLFHNEKFADKNLPWIYLQFPCTDLDALMSHATRFGIRGFSVTHPFKEEIIPYLNLKSKEVELLRSCNTVYRQGNQWHGINTDVYGFEELLRQNGLSLGGSRVAIVGAGGAARAAAFVALQQEAELFFLNRTHSKAETLAAVFNGTAIPLSQLSSVEYDVLIQTTPVGMKGDDIPINPDSLHSAATVIDVIYEPHETLLLQKARALGCRVINGEQWFLAQAQAQFDWWGSIKAGETPAVPDAGATSAFP